VDNNHSRGGKGGRGGGRGEKEADPGSPGAVMEGTLSASLARVPLLNIAFK